jgi:acyl-CoA thioesterase FadM
MPPSKFGASALDSPEFGWMHRGTAPVADEGGLVSGIQIARTLHDSATDLVAELFGVSSPAEFSSLAVRPILRAMGATFERPLFPGTTVFTGATLGMLSERSFALITGIWSAADRRLCAHGTASFVAINVESQRAVPLPDAAVESLRRLRPDLSATVGEGPTPASPT